MTRFDDEKDNPDRIPTPHEIDQSQRAADHESIEDAIARPQDGLDRVEEFGVESADQGEGEKGTPDLADQLDHAGLEGETPEDHEDHPGGTTEEPSKGIQSRWGKTP